VSERKISSSWVINGEETEDLRDESLKDFLKVYPALRKIHDEIQPIHKLEDFDHLDNDDMLRELKITL
jgi:hypothetical protein